MKRSYDVVEAKICGFCCFSTYWKNLEMFVWQAAAALSVHRTKSQNSQRNNLPSSLRPSLSHYLFLAPFQLCPTPWLYLYLLPLPLSLSRCTSFCTTLPTFLSSILSVSSCFPLCLPLSPLFPLLLAFSFSPYFHLVLLLFSSLPLTSLFSFTPYPMLAQ